MTLLLLFFAATLGLIFGSFLNVCIYRIPRDLSIVAPRSFCPECGKQLSWFQNIPVLSYLLLKGRCRNCSQPIGVRYPIVELVTSILFALVAFQYGATLAAGRWAVFEALLIILFWTDLEERILPDEVTLGGCFAGIVFALVTIVPSSLGMLLFHGLSERWQSLLNAGIGAALLAMPIWLIALAYGRIRKRDTLGLGDVKLLAMIGIFLGPDNGFVALLIGVVGGAVVSIFFLLATRKEASSYELPFGSFLCVGAALVPLLTGRLHYSLAVP
ncbi:MAG: prepilin peptidase [Acidobacteriota bacterium]|nr:prepilin peptidase [Acidobacteriota bacterium]MDQ2840933.1 prepilin peptidase [Acidobacteriota bacterium]